MGWLRVLCGSSTVGCEQHPHDSLCAQTNSGAVWARPDGFGQRTKGKGKRTRRPSSSLIVSCSKITLIQGYIAGALDKPCEGR